MRLLEHGKRLGHARTLGALKGRAARHERTDAIGRVERQRSCAQRLAAAERERTAGLGRALPGEPRAQQLPGKRAEGENVCAAACGRGSHAARGEHLGRHVRESAATRVREGDCADAACAVRVCAQRREPEVSKPHARLGAGRQQHIVD